MKSTVFLKCKHCGWKYYFKLNTENNNLPIEERPEFSYINCPSCSHNLLEYRSDDNNFNDFEQLRILCLKIK